MQEDFYNFETNLGCRMKLSLTTMMTVLMKEEEEEEGERKQERRRQGKKEGKKVVKIKIKGLNEPKMKV